MSSASPSFRPFRLARRLSLAKNPGANEDRWAFGRRAWALCDGASEGFDGAGWAGSLAGSLVQPGNPERAVSRARAAYAEAAERRRVRDGAGNDWLSLGSAFRGSWSTALLARVGSSGASVEVFARGDTVFFLRDGLDTRVAFPLDDASAFGSSPPLVADRPGEAEPFRRAVYGLRAFFRPRLVLTTDALAERILREPDRTRTGLWAFLDRCAPREFAAWARGETAAGRLRPDDLTMLELAP